MAVTLDQAYKLLNSAWKRDRLAHAFMITGARKELLRELAAKVVGMVNAPSDLGGTDLFGAAPVAVDRKLEDWQGTYMRMLEPRSKSRIIKVGEIRELEKLFYQAAPGETWKVGVIVDADRMNEAACNAFLKTLEEPPDGSLLLLLTTEPEQMLPTILSRCVEVSLHVEGETIADRFPEWILDVIKDMMTLLGDGLGNVDVALGLRGLFSAALSIKRDEISAAHLADQKAEILQYKKATDGTWLKEREEYFKALIEADYQVERSKLIDALLSWMGDVARAHAGSADRDFPAYAEVSTKAAEGLSVEDVLARVEALRELKRRLEKTNVQEQLSLDVAFLDAFA